MEYLMINFNKGKYVLIIIVSLILINCKKITSNDNFKDNNCYVEFHYYNQGTHFPMRLACGTLKSGNPNNGRNYKKLYDKIFVNKLVSYYSNLKNAKEERFDARIQFLVHLPNKVDTICMGEYFGIVINGTTKEDSEEFINFVKKEIYSNGSNDTDGNNPALRSVQK